MFISVKSVLFFFIIDNEKASKAKYNLESKNTKENEQKINVTRNRSKKHFTISF